MKINDKNENYTTYGEIDFGECFKYPGNNYIYMKGEHFSGNTYDVNLQTGFITDRLEPNEKVIYLPNATVNMYGGD